MAEIAMAAFGGLTSAASGVSSAIGLSSGFMGVLQGVASVGSVLMGFAQGNQALEAGRAAQNEALFNAELATIEGERQANESRMRALEIRRETVKKIGAARVAFAGSGLSSGSGQLAGIEGSIEGDAAFGLALEKNNERQAIAGAALKGTQFRLQGLNAMQSAKARQFTHILGGVLGGAQGLIDIKKRG